MTEQKLREKITAYLWKWRGSVPLYPNNRAHALLALFKEAGWKSPEELKGWVQLAEDAQNQSANGG